MTKASKSTSFVISANLQKAFILLAVTTGVLSLLLSVYYIVQQYPHNSNLSGLIPMLVGNIVPLVLFAVPFVLGMRRKMSRLNRVFEASFLAVTGGLALMLLTTLVFFAQGALSIDYGNYDGYAIMTYAPIFIIVTAYVLLVAYYLRKRR